MLPVNRKLRNHDTYSYIFYIMHNNRIMNYFFERETESEYKNN